MARLPIPGSDDGSWGDILNEFLGQSHNADGTLKSTAIQPKLPDADSTTKGVVTLTGDLGGTAASPTVPGLSDKANSADLTSHISSTSAHAASAITYDNASSGLVATRAQAAIDEIASSVTNLSPSSPNVQTANYILQLSDANKVVEINAASANTVTIPANTAVSFPVGTTIEIVQIGSGATTVEGAVGVTVHNAGALDNQYKRATIQKRATDEWLTFIEVDRRIIPNQQTVNYTLVMSDAGKVIEMNSASATSVTIPPDSSVNFPIGTHLEIFQRGTGTVSIIAGSGVTALHSSSSLDIIGQYSTVGLRKSGANEWVASGEFL